MKIPPVARIRWCPGGKRSISLPGDAEKQTEHSILTENDPAAMPANGFKIGHHGSKNSSMPEFPAALGAQIGTL